MADAAADLERRLGRPSASWTYHDADGEPVGAVFRWDPPSGKKIIRPVSRRATGWVVGGMKAPRPLYCLPELASARRIFITEGEKAADALRSIGLIATTSPHGSKAASVADWSPMAGKECVIVPDNDLPGRQYAAEVAGLLFRQTPATTVKVIELPGLPPGGDAVEFLEARECQEPEEIVAAIEELVEAAPVWRADGTSPGAAVRGPVLVCLRDVQPVAINWLWPARIAIGKLTLLAGDPGLGKSLLTLDMAARVSSSTSWPDCQDALNPAGGVVLLSAEDDPADTIRPRLDAAEADASRIVLLQAVRTSNPDTGGIRPTPFNLSLDLPALDDAIAAVRDCRLVIIDPVSAYLGRTDSHINAEVRSVLAPLTELASRRGVAVVAVTHLRKGEGPAMYRAMGSLAFVAAARAAWAVTKDKDDPTGQRRFLLPVKNNISADQKGLAYALRHAPNGAARVVWERQPVAISADDALAAPTHRRGPQPEEQDRAEAWLREALAGGPRPARDLLEEATNGVGLHKRTVDRARQSVGVVAFRLAIPGPWQWRLPDQDCRVVPQPEQHGNLGNLAESTIETGLSGQQDPKVAKLREPGSVLSTSTPAARAAGQGGADQVRNRAEAGAHG